MRRRLNVKLISYLFVGLLIFGVSVHFIHGMQVRKNADGLIERATAYREEGNLSESVRLLARYLMHFPESPDIAKQAAMDAKKNLFDAWAARKEPDRREVQTTVSLIENAGRIAAFDEELKRESADFWFKIGRWSDAIDLLDQIENQAKADVSKPPTDREPFTFTIDDKLRRIESLRRIGSPRGRRKSHRANSPRCLALILERTSST